MLMNKERAALILNRIARICFYLAVLVETAIVIVDKSAYTDPIEGRLFQITFALFTVKCILTRYSKKEYLTIAFFLILGAVSYFVTGRNEIIRVVMFIAACKDVDMFRCLRIVFYVTAAGCAGIVLLSLTGIYGDTVLIQYYGRGGMETRYTLGMGHPNALQCMAWALTTLGLYLFGEKMKHYAYLLVVMFNVGLFLLTGSKTGLMVTLLVIALAYMVKAGTPRIKRLCGVLCGVLTVSGIGISVFFAASAYRLHDYAWFSWIPGVKWPPLTLFLARLDSALTGRIRVLTENDAYAGTLGSWRAFSTPDSVSYFDLGWVRLFYWYGIVPACAGIAALCMLMYFCYRKKRYMELVMIASFAVYTVVEAHAVSVYLARNYLFFLAGMYWPQVLQELERLWNDAKSAIMNHQSGRG